MTPGTDFVHLHVHSCYSLLDGLIPVGELVAKAKKEGMHSLALTDHGNMFGILEFYEAALSKGIRPIVGCEVYVAPVDRKIKEKATENEEYFYHLVLLARDMAGYRNLMAIVTDSWLTGFYYKPRTDLGFLKEHSAGLIAFSACLGGQVPSLLRAGDILGAEKAALELQSIFPDSFYLELQVNGLEEQAPVNEALAAMSKRLGIPLVATNDVHFLEREDFEAHTVLMAVNRKITLAEAKNGKSMHFTPEVYFKSAEKMAGDFSRWPEAVENTGRIARQCHLELDLKTLHFPRFPVPEGFDTDSYFEQEVRKGLVERYPKMTGEVRARAEMEIAVIRKMNFAGYFLIVWDFVRYAREQGIPVGPGRGSAAGSIVSYALRITDIDPLRYGLLFERFLNPERRSMPDIDMDFADDRRDEVIRYIRQKYGERNVAQIVTYNTMGARTAVKDTARAFGMSAADGEKLAKILPEQMSFSEALKEAPALRREMEATPETKQIFSIARRLESTLRQYGKHAAGTLIADRDVSDYVPLCLDKDDNILSQYDKNCVEKVGLIKMDLLGLITLSVIRDTLREIRNVEGKEIDLDALPLDDKKTFHLLQRGRTVGVFQMEAAGFTKTLLNLKPTSMDDLAALLALYRPGPLMSGVVDTYIKRKHGLESVDYPDPKLEGILKETYGVIVYQEQVMQIARVMSGFSLAQADHIRKAMGKKDEVVMNQQMEKLLDGAKATGFDLRVAGKMTELIREFSKYAFNKSHSAAYAHVAWQTAWLKAHYPAEFMASLLTHEMGKQEKLVKNINECRSLKIRVLRPDINRSFEHFTVCRDGPQEAKAICFCLTAVKGVGSKAVSAIVEEREKRGLFADFLDFCRRVDGRLVNKRVLEALIKVGAFDSVEPARARLVENIDGIQAYVNRLRGQEESGQIQLFNEPVEFRYRDVPDWDEVKRLEHEKELLGYYVSSHPLAKYADILERIRIDRTSALAETPEDTMVRLAGLVVGLRQEIIKEKYLKILFDLEDYEGSVTVELWEDMARKYRDILKEKSLVQVEGKLKFFANQVKVSAANLVVMENLSETSVADIHIRVSVVGLEEEALSGLKKELLENKGQAGVYLHFFEPHPGERLQDKETRVLRVYDQIRCKPSRRLNAFLSDHFGEDSYWFDLKR